MDRRRFLRVVGLGSVVPAALKTSEATAQQQSDGPIVMEELGAKGDGQSFNDRIIEQALGADAPLHFGSGTFRFAAPWPVVGDRPISVRGAGGGSTRFVFEQLSGPGISIHHPNGNHPIHLEGFSILTPHRNPSPGIGMTFSVRPREREGKWGIVRDIEVSGLAETAGWDMGLDISQGHGLLIEEFLFRGAINFPRSLRMADICLASAGINLRCPPETGGPPYIHPTDIKISRPRIFNAVYGIRDSGNFEGLIIQNHIIVTTRYGISLICDRPLPYSDISHGHLNVFEVGIHVENVAQNFITNNLIYKFKGTNVDTTAISLVDASDTVAIGNIIKNETMPEHSTGGLVGFDIVDSNDCNIHDNNIARYTIAYRIRERRRVALRNVISAANTVSPLDSNASMFQDLTSRRRNSFAGPPTF
jgi:hypothetical protein